MGNAEFQTNDAQLIQTIKDSVEVQRFTPEAGELFSHKLNFAPEKPLSDTIKLASLTGIIDYLNHGIDTETRNGIFVHVVSPTMVSVRGVLPHREDRRFTPVATLADVPKNALLDGDEWTESEEAIITLQSCFVATDEQKELIRILGTLVKDDAIEKEDDGVSQTVSTRSGVKVKNETITNPVILRPFRTFSEVEQPESPFIVRIDKDSFEVGLFLADGGAWRNTARLAIKAFIESKLTVTQLPVLA